MFRALTIIGAAVVLAISASPATAGSSQAKVSRPDIASFSIDVGTSEAAKRVTDGTSNTLQSVSPRPTPNGIIAILIG
jgi:hypothetical protein